MPTNHQSTRSSVPNRPNVIIVMTDDQGYGDLGCTGNPWIKTPNIDRFHDEAVRLTDFHVQPLCTPSRGGIMSGHRPVRNGAWATTWGRSMLKREETTLADVFSASGYRTGLFGKWHLGDNYPYRPQDRGFETVVAHRGGGVGQTPDFWGNRYFDDTYFHNGKPVGHEGYCTDIWFNEALHFIDDHAREPFFVYLATNAPHDPYLVADRYTAPYRDNPDIPNPPFYGMIANIDENFGRLRAKLQELGIQDQTLLIFMTDNGTSGGCRLGDGQMVTKGYNAGMRGAKGSYYDGGHRVPFFMSWPEKNIGGGQDLTEMGLDIDLLPTFIDLFGLQTPSDWKGDGTSLAPLLLGQQECLPGDRIHFLQYRQNTSPPEKWTNAVITRQWRLIGGKELYDIRADPGQTTDVSSHHPKVVARLRAAHETWWAEVEPGLDAYCPIVIGNDAENPLRLDALDVMGDVAWHQTHIVMAQRSCGKWAVEVDRPGRYQFSLRRWPKELNLPIDAADTTEDARHHTYAGPEGESRAINPIQARLKLGAREAVCPIAPGCCSVDFVWDVESTGVSILEAWFEFEAGDRQGAYYVYVERQPS